MSEALELLERARLFNSYIVIIAPVTQLLERPSSASAVMVETAEQADTVIDMLFTPENHSRFSAASDYVAVWKGAEFVTAYLANGKQLSEDNFIHYIEEWL